MESNGKIFQKLADERGALKLYSYEGNSNCLQRQCSMQLRTQLFACLLRHKFIIVNGVYPQVSMDRIEA